MKLATYWWGCEFAAETDEDVRILEQLAKSEIVSNYNVWNKSECLELVHPEEYIDMDDGFSFKDDLKNIKRILTIHR